MPLHFTLNNIKSTSVGSYIFLVCCLCGLAVSTVWLYWSNEAQRVEMYKSVRMGNWGAFQAQLEYLKLEHVVTDCLDGGDCVDKPILQQAEIFASRLDVLAHSQEYDGIDFIEHQKAALVSLYNQLTMIFDQYQVDDDGQDSALGRALARQVGETLDEARILLQQLLRETTMFNSAIERREAALRDTSPGVPFLLLTFSGLALITMMMTEIRHRGRVLRELDEMRHQDQAQRENVVRLLDTLPAPVCVIDHTGRLTYQNAAAIEVLGERMGDNAGALASESLMARPGDVVTRRLSLYTADGRPHSFKCHLMQIGWNENAAVVWVLNDAPVDGNAQLLTLAVGKMAILGELSSAIAHELNQPLATIKAAALNAQLLLTREEPAERVTGKLGRINDQVDRMSRIVSNIRALAAPAAPATSFDLHSVINASIDVVGHQYMLAAIQLIVTDACNSNKTILGDPTLLELALLNILLNARDAFVSRAESHGSDRRVELSIIRADGAVRLEIADNAGGIDPELLPTIFDSFVTSKAKSGGMGVGLAISRRSIEQMGGQITAANVGPGAQFTIRLPLAK